MEWNRGRGGKGCASSKVGIQGDSNQGIDGHAQVSGVLLCAGFEGGGESEGCSHGAEW